MSLLGTTQGFIALLGVAVLIALAAERLRISSAVALVAFGAGTAAIHPVTLPFQLNDVLLYVFLPPLIFEAAWNIDSKALRRVAARVALLALPGLLLIVGLIGIGIAASGLLPLSAALLFGTIVSATDPIAVIAIFRRLHIPSDLQLIVEAEAIANDGVAIVLYGLAMAFVTGAQTSVLTASAQAVVAMVGGVVIGIVCGFAIALLMGRTSEASIEVTATFVLAFLAYLLAAQIGFSGVFATAAAAITLREVQRTQPIAGHADDVDAFWSTAAFIANALVFLLVGLTIALPQMLHQPLLVVVAIAAVVLSRALVTLAVVRDWSWRWTIVLAGMRGGLSLALALALPNDLPYREQLVDAVFGVVLFTLVVQGLTLEPILARLRF